MKAYTIYYWLRDEEGTQVSLGFESMMDKKAAFQAAMTAARRGYHANIISGGKLVYAQ